MSTQPTSRLRTSIVSEGGDAFRQLIASKDLDNINPVLLGLSTALLTTVLTLSSPSSNTACHLVLGSFMVSFVGTFGPKALGYRLSRVVDAEHAMVEMVTDGAQPRRLEENSYPEEASSVALPSHVPEVHDAAEGAVVGARLLVRGSGILVLAFVSTALLLTGIFVLVLSRPQM